jgi:hypothetical protein
VRSRVAASKPSAEVELTVVRCEVEIVHPLSRARPAASGSNTGQREGRAW